MIVSPSSEQLISWAELRGDYGEYTQIPTSAWESIIWIWRRMEAMPDIGAGSLDIDALAAKLPSKI